ncbi:hypothetical protein [Sorangium sp. So ce204]|uniref:hypothetical protein n=1 Tax=Sorangium sp. So ce204 TaxID=3133288 RepID=UPI003F5DCF0A
MLCLIASGTEVKSCDMEAIGVHMGQPGQGVGGGEHVVDLVPWARELLGQRAAPPGRRAP